MVPWILEEEKLKGFLAGLQQYETEIVIFSSSRKTNCDEAQAIENIYSWGNKN